MIAMPKSNRPPTRAKTPPRASARRTAAAPGGESLLPTSPAALRKLLQLLPKFDPYADAGDCRFDREAAEKPLRFIRKYVRDRKGNPIALQPWQVCILANLFGWLRPNGLRRFRDLFVYVPRKNGKTTLVAIVVLYVLLCDGEPAVEIYSAASTHEQARLLLAAAKQIVRKDPTLSKQLRLFRDSIVRVAKGGRAEAAYKTIPADPDAAHGPNPHLLVIDELHAIKNREFIDVITSANGERDQPITVMLTTADFARPSYCNDQLRHAKQVCAGVIQDRGLLPAVYAADESDDWTLPSTWAKANPNIDVSVKSEWLASKCNKAKGTIAAERAFKRLHLNLQTGAASAWLKLETWDQAPPLDLADLKTRPCWGGLDLGTTDDPSAFVLVFPPRNDNETWACLPWFWASKEMAVEHARKHQVPYLEWERDDLFTLTEDLVTGRRQIRDKIKAIREEFPGLVGIGVDIRFAYELASTLRDVDGFDVHQVAQTFGQMAAPTKELERLVISKQLAHGGHPVLRWMAGNVHLKGGRNGSDFVMPCKPESSPSQKIDGIAALVIALARAMTRPVVAPKPFIYATQGVRSL